MSCKDYSDIAVLIEEAPNEINNMLYKELVFSSFFNLLVNFITHY